jgi:hypothetical protein
MLPLDSPVTNAELERNLIANAKQFSAFERRRRRFNSKFDYTVYTHRDL